MSELSLSVGLAHKLAVAFGRNGWNVGEVDSLCEGDNLTKIRSLLGYIDRPSEHIVNLDAEPYVPGGSAGGFVVEKHRKMGSFTWDPSKVKLWLSDAQQEGGREEAEFLLQIFEDEPVFNACLLDYLFEHPYLIPNHWKQLMGVYFWGTTYRLRDLDPQELPIVRYLAFRDGKWRRFWTTHGDLNNLDENQPAAMLVTE